MPQIKQMTTDFSLKLKKKIRGHLFYLCNLCAIVFT